MDDAEACQTACTEQATCNAASFYKEKLEKTGKNCYLKNMASSCNSDAPPEDAKDDPNAVLMMLQCDDFTVHKDKDYIPAGIFGVSANSVKVSVWFLALY